jgi:hypothetical protein
MSDERSAPGAKGWTPRERTRVRVADAEAALHLAKHQGKPEPAKDQAIFTRATTELSRLSNFKDFIDRYGQAAFDLLTARELELVTLHRELSRLEGSGGHVHPT